MKEASTRDQILKIARNYLQRLGFNAFSFQMIADELGIRKPSLYHHFASKEELGLVIIEQYKRRFERWIQSVQGEEPMKKLKQYFLIFENFSMDDEKLCPIGALSMDIHNIPESMRTSIRELSQMHHDWLKKVIKEGIKKGEFISHLEVGTMTTLVMSTLQGTLLLSRIQQDPKLFPSVRKNLEKLIGG